VATSEPGLQVCTANYFPKDEAESLIRRHGAICLETQKPPDAINHANFPRVVLRRGDVYESTTVLIFEGSSVDASNNNDDSNSSDGNASGKQRRLGEAQETSSIGV
jgi:hypothetical protein